MPQEPTEKQDEKLANKSPITNCHTHIFTGNNVPPFLAKTFIPAPFHVIAHLGLFIRLFRWWYKGPATIPYQAWYKKLRIAKTRLITFLDQFSPLRTILEYYIVLQVFYLAYYLLPAVIPTEKTMITKWVSQFGAWLKEYGLLWPIGPVWIRIVIILLVFLFIKSFRNMVFFVARNMWSALRKLPGKETKEMFLRYLNIGRFSFHKNQSLNFTELRDQYPPGSRFIILPMDMEFMKAGKPDIRYRDQMKELDEIKTKNKNNFLPFVFADPGRMVPLAEEKRTKPGDKIYFDYTAIDGRVTLGDCFMRDYLEEKKFSGIKIYPALGYYPFDASLLALWKYAADRSIPIMTHCVRGPMFYRGKKKPVWNTHPYFKESLGKKKTDPVAGNNNPPEESVMVPLELTENKNTDFSANFTHPMNFLCLLEEELLREVVADAIEKKGEQRLRDVFGFTDRETPLLYNLRHLKICLGHYGGGDEWLRYFDKDRFSPSNQIIKGEKGINFFHYKPGQFSTGKTEQLWRYADWYSIISSMMLQFPNVYADISYILHNDAEILPLLKQTLQRPELRSKVLYGTDFFVVRNHKSDKNMLADMMGGLSVEDFDEIARKNPITFLKTLPPSSETGSASGLGAA